MEIKTKRQIKGICFIVFLYMWANDINNQFIL
jgi:hypothetical protein